MNIYKYLPWAFIVVISLYLCTTLGGKCCYQPTGQIRKLRRRVVKRLVHIPISRLVQIPASPCPYPFCSIPQCP